MKNIEHVWRKELMLAVEVNDLTKLHTILNTSKQTNCDHFSLDFKWKMEANGYYLFSFYSPVTLAIQHNHAEAFKLLLEAGASTEFLTPITEATVLQHTEMLRILLQYGADVSGQQWKTALQNAVRCNHPGMVALLLEHTPSGLMYGQNSWRLVCDNKITALLELFLNHASRNNITVPSEYIFQRSWLSIVNIMMRNGFFPYECATSEEVFYQAAMDRSTSTIQMLMVQRPMLLQLFKGNLQGLINKFRQRGFNEMKNLLSGMRVSRAMLHCPSLQAQCKASILVNVEQCYMERVNLLPLPKTLIEYIQSLLPEVDFSL